LRRVVLAPNYLRGITSPLFGSVRWINAPKRLLFVSPPHHLLVLVSDEPRCIEMIDLNF